MIDINTMLKADNKAFLDVDNLLELRETQDYSSEEKINFYVRMVVASEVEGSYSALVADDNLKKTKAYCVEMVLELIKTVGYDVAELQFRKEFGSNILKALFEGDKKVIETKANFLLPLYNAIKETDGDKNVLYVWSVLNLFYPEYVRNMYSLIRKELLKKQTINRLTEAEFKSELKTCGSNRLKFCNEHVASYIYSYELDDTDLSGVYELSYTHRDLRTVGKKLGLKGLLPFDFIAYVEKDEKGRSAKQKTVTGKQSNGNAIDDETVNENANDKGNTVSEELLAQRYLHGKASGSIDSLKDVLQSLADSRNDARYAENDGTKGNFMRAVYDIAMALDTLASENLNGIDSDDEDGDALRQLLDKYGKPEQKEPTA